jgi:hypothetical protein
MLRSFSFFSLLIFVLKLYVLFLLSVNLKYCVMQRIFIVKTCRNKKYYIKLEIWKSVSHSFSFFLSSTGEVDSLLAYFADETT